MIGFKLFRGCCLLFMVGMVFAVERGFCYRGLVCQENTVLTGSDITNLPGDANEIEPTLDECANHTQLKDLGKSWRKLGPNGFPEGDCLMLGFCTDTDECDYVPREKPRVTLEQCADDPKSKNFNMYRSDRSTCQSPEAEVVDCFRNQRDCIGDPIPMFDTMLSDLCPIATSSWGEFGLGKCSGVLTISCCPENCAGCERLTYEECQAKGWNQYCSEERGGCYDNESCNKEGLLGDPIYGLSFQECLDSSNAKSFQSQGVEAPCQKIGQCHNCNDCQGTCLFSDTNDCGGACSYKTATDAICTSIGTSFRVGRDGQGTCTDNGQPVPSPIECPADVKECPDGSFVGRDPTNDCQFPECLKPVDPECCYSLEQYELSNGECPICGCCANPGLGKFPGAGETCTICPCCNAPGVDGRPCLEGCSVDGKTSVVMGDPHVMNWQGTWFDYQGSCDLLYLMVENIVTGLSMWIYIRTTSRVDFSFIESAAIQVGDNVLEVNGHGHHALDWVDNAALDEAPALGGIFPIQYSKVSDKQHVYDIVLGDHEFITISSYKDILSVKVTNGTAAHFQNSIGLLGNYTTGELLSRTGKVMTDMDAFGSNWQVREDEPKLFMATREPQYPQECVLPSPKISTTHRRLGETIARSKAEAACAHLSGKIFDNCVFDVMASGSMDFANY